MADRVRVLVGTKKAAFIYTSDEKRERWQLSEPMLAGWSVHHMAADVRNGAPRLYAAANHWAWGRSVARSVDDGQEWDWRCPGLSFPADMGIAVEAVWHVTPGHEREPGVVYAGTQPAGLFRSEDGGDSWAPVDGINRHELRKYWGGTGGNTSSLHSVEIDPRDAQRMYISISSGGSHVTKDGGKTWQLCSHRAVPKPETRRPFDKQMEGFSQFLDPSLFPPPLPPGVDPAAADEMHKLRMDAKDPDRLWGQAHIGVFRSDDGGGDWEDVTAGLPSFHGFPIAVTRRAPDAAFVVPLEFERNNFRVCAGQLAVYRTRDAGRSWERLTDGLPGPGDYQSVYREGLDTDGLDREGVYMGTSNGGVYASIDGGDHWQRLPGTLPPILSVTCAVM
ncbi:MAG: exo-alpha-sialidase [Dehalococcoidia bacterium]